MIMFALRSTVNMYKMHNAHAKNNPKIYKEILQNDKLNVFNLNYGEKNLSYDNTYWIS